MTPGPAELAYEAHVIADDLMCAPSWADLPDKARQVWEDAAAAVLRRPS